MRVVLLYVVPLLVASFPLVALLGITHLPFVKRSALGLALATLGSVVSGWYSSWLALLACAHELSRNMPAGEPRCVTGAVVFVPIGLCFTLLAFLVGLGLTLKQVISQPKQ